MADTGNLFEADRRYRTAVEAARRNDKIDLLADLLDAQAADAVNDVQAHADAPMALGRREKAEAEARSAKPPPGQVHIRCLVCGRLMQTEVEALNCILDGVHCESLGNYGSSAHDALVDHGRAEFGICDACYRKRVCDGTIRRVPLPRHPKWPPGPPEKWAELQKGKTRLEAVIARHNAWHKSLWAVTQKLESDFEPYGLRDRAGDYGPDCSCGCSTFHKLWAPAVRGWGVCFNPASPRAGLLTFEHQGCKAYAAEGGDTAATEVTEDTEKGSE